MGSKKRDVCMGGGGEVKLLVYPCCVCGGVGESKCELLRGGCGCVHV